MCQIMYIKSDNLQTLTIEEIEKIEYIMFKKGQKYNISGIIFNNNELKKFSFTDRKHYIDFFEKIDDSFKDVIMFSRQAPEMEVSDYNNIDKQPYYNKNMDRYFFIHGTIYNDRKLSEKYKKDIKIDTEVLNFIEDIDEIEGLYSYIYYDVKKKRVNYKNFGLGLWSYCNKTLFKNSVDKLVITQNIDNYGKLIDQNIEVSNNNKILFAAYSGGMDISFSICKQLEDENYSNVYLNYFDFGTKSRNEEMESLEKFGKYISKQYNIPVKIFIHNDRYFKEYFKLLNIEPKLTIEESIAEENEAEENITYVPYRNSQFILLMTSLAESMDLYNVDFILGLNLSEGMVYMDNAEPWLQSVNSMIKFGGKDPKQTLTFNVVSPYFMKTKTNMLKDFIEKYGKEKFERILEITISCYYPDRYGKPCNKCGSCKLRNRAIERAINGK